MGLDMCIFDSDKEDKVELAYWRKANAIHRWFVDNIQNGVDDCGIYPVNMNQLASLKQTCLNVLADWNLKSELLPTSSGFFFGDTSYDDFYIRHLEYTVEAVSLILEGGKETVYYWSSW